MRTAASGPVCGRAGRRAVTVLALAALTALGGCAVLAPGPDPWAPPAGTAPSVELAQVPFFPQDDDLCGPAALATALQAAGIPRTPQDLTPQVYLPGRRGSLQVEMLGATRRAGAIPHVLAGRPEDLLREVAAGHPVVVLQDLGGWWQPRWHYAVVVGYDLAQDRLTLRSGTLERLDMGLAAFDRSWVRVGRWAFVALPPGQLPATAQAARYLAAVADFERVSPATAAPAYEAALAAWPGHLVARLALGNAAYRQRDLDTAARHYRQATEDHPQAADAWNNLAQVLWEQGRPRDAQAAARQAVALGGPRAATYAATLATIEAGVLRPMPAR